MKKNLSVKISFLPQMRHPKLTCETMIQISMEKHTHTPPGDWKYAAVNNSLEKSRLKRSSRSYWIFGQDVISAHCSLSFNRFVLFSLFKRRKTPLIFFFSNCNTFACNHIAWLWSWGLPNHSPQNATTETPPSNLNWTRLCWTLKVEIKRPPSPTSNPRSKNNASLPVGSRAGQYKVLKNRKTSCKSLCTEPEWLQLQENN